MSQTSKPESMLTWALRQGPARLAAEFGMTTQELIALLNAPPPPPIAEKPLDEWFPPLDAGRMEALRAALAKADDAHVVRRVALDIAGLHEPVVADGEWRPLSPGSNLRPEARPLYAAELSRRFPEGVVGGATVWAYAPEVAEMVPRIVVADGRYGT